MFQQCVTTSKDDHSTSKDDDITSKDFDITSKDDDIPVIHKRICMNIQNGVWKTKFKCSEKLAVLTVLHLSDVRCDICV